MIVLVTLTFGLVVWVVAWAFGIKSFDAFIFTGLITALAAGVQIVMPTLKQLRTGRPGPESGS